METTPNPVEKAFDAASDMDANQGGAFDRTVSTPEAEPTVDYKTKFSESSREALRLLEDNKLKEAEIERLRNQSGPLDQGNSSESLYPGFEQLSEEEQKNLLQFSRSVESKVKADINNDPAISFARSTYNEKKFDDALAAVTAAYPELSASKDEFKSKYFQPNNTPDNIQSILSDLAKVHLFDQQRNAGVEEERARAERIDMERVNGGSNGAPSQVSRSLEEWQQIAQQNPAKFATMKKDYDADMASGKLGE